jgi:glycosyltransferase involved in cell wall biosynthesis
MSSIDIVIPCYRYGQYLRECVQSVLSQGVANCRILVIDDESPDETPQVAQALVAEDSRVTYRRHTVNRGHIKTYNEGIDWCESDYMLLISADDYLLPGALDRAMRLLDEHPAMGLCFGEAVELAANGASQDMTIGADFHGNASVVLAGEEFIRLCIAKGARNIVPTPTAIVRTARLKQSGTYRLELPHSADMELWLRLAACGPVGIVNSQQAVYRRHAGNMSLAYMSDNRVSDLRQRKLAFDIFLADCKDVLPDAAKLHEGLLQALASDAVVEASMTFNANRLTLSKNLCEVATEFYPGVRRTYKWRMLSLKKMIGVQASNALRPLFAKIR